MPIYEFKCIKCNEYKELLLKNKEKIDLKCSKCGSKNLKRILSKTNIAKDKTQSKNNSYSKNRTCSSGSCSTYNFPGPT